MIRKAVELDPQNYAFLDSLGWAYFKAGPICAWQSSTCTKRLSARRLIRRCMTT